MHIRPTIHTPLIHRAQIKLHISSLILQQLYGKSQQLFQDIYRDIHNEQKELVKAQAYAKDFTFRGKRHSYGIVSVVHVPVELHPSLHERMQKYIDDRAQVFDYEKPCVEGVLKAMFTHTEFISDWKELLPESLHRCFEGYEEPFRSMDNKRFSDSQMADFKERNERYLQLINNRMMLNILL